MQLLIQDLNRGLNPFQPGQRLSVPTPRLNPLIDLQVVELYPYMEYIKYLLAGSISMSIFIVPLLFAFRFSKDPKPQRGLRRTAIGTLLYLVVWSLLGPPLYMSCSSG